MKFVIYIFICLGSYWSYIWWSFLTVSPGQCQPKWVFYKNYVFYDANDPHKQKEYAGISTASECMRLCMDEQDIQCVTAELNSYSKICNTHFKTRNANPAKFIYAPGWDYYEVVCEGKHLMILNILSQLNYITLISTSWDILTGKNVHNLSTLLQICKEWHNQ